jgi:hypothetical protein
MRLLRLLAPAVAALALSACATSPYTGPVEVTRFVAADQAAQLGRGTIALEFPDEVSNESARSAFSRAVGAELSRLGYTVVDSPAAASQTAAIRTSRTAIAATEERRGPVSVGVGGSTGSFGSGLGMGVGINLGGGSEGPAVMTLLEVRINQAGGTSLWEGRSQISTGVKSPYSNVDVSARTLAAGLFKDFPGGNGETVTISVKKLQGSK